jgi:hypothetical protein
MIQTVYPFSLTATVAPDLHTTSTSFVLVTGSDRVELIRAADGTIASQLVRGWGFDTILLSLL